MTLLRGGLVHRSYSVTVFIVLAALDNVAIGLVPSQYTRISHALDIGEGALGLVTAASFLMTAVAAVGWAFVGDRTNRKPLLMVGTLLWSAGTVLTVLSSGFAGFFAAQVLAALGLGAVASVGFSVVSDLITPRRRGLVMSLWGLSQGVGTLAGVLLGSQLGDGDWRRPFELLAGVGLAASVAYFFTYDIRRGQSEPDLAAVFAAGEQYEYRITKADLLFAAGARQVFTPFADLPTLDGPGDLPRIVSRRTNVWLIMQGLTAQVAFGSLVWLPRLFQAKAEAQGFDEETAIRLGGLLATLFQLGGVLSILGGIIGDRWQRRDLGGRAKVAAIGILAGIPMYVVLFFTPLDLSPPESGNVSAAGLVLGGLFTSPSLAVAFLCAAGARPHLRQFTELVRADRRCQPTRAPGYRLLARQPGQRLRAGGRQRPRRHRIQRAGPRFPATDEHRDRSRHVPGFLHTDRHHVLAGVAHFTARHRGGAFPAPAAGGRRGAGPRARRMSRQGAWWRARGVLQSSIVDDNGGG